MTSFSLASCKYNISGPLNILDLLKGKLTMTLASMATGTHYRMWLTAWRCGSLFLTSVVAVTAPAPRAF